MTNTKLYTLVLLRLAMGWLFSWAFFDKLWGLGWPTAPEQSWLAGNSPTAGFLKLATHGSLAGIFQNLAGYQIVDYLFMIGLALVGLSLLIGIATKIATGAGMTIMLLIYLAALPPEHNPLIDEHIVYIFVLLTLKINQADHYWGLGRRWSQIKLVKKYKFLQ